VMLTGNSDTKKPARAPAAGSAHKGSVAPRDLASELSLRCEKVAKACSDTPKHVEQLVGECKAAAKQQLAKSCAETALTAYDCYEHQLCGKADKVWALDDFRVLAARQKQCVTEAAAVRSCLEK
jgi:hypothetical protein